MTNVAIIYYSATGNVHKLAQTAAESAEKAGAEVRFRRVAELVPDEVIAENENWVRHREATADIAEATLADLDWADVVLFGTPTRFGLPAAQLKQFIDSASSLWFQGRLVNKVGSSFSSSSTAHGGQESTILALNNVFYHWGMIIVPPGYADEVQFAETNGNPYGASSVSANSPANVTGDNLASVDFQARRAVEVAEALRRGFEATVT